MKKIIVLFSLTSSFVFSLHTQDLQDKDPQKLSRIISLEEVKETEILLERIPLLILASMCRAMVNHSPDNEKPYVHRIAGKTSEKMQELSKPDTVTVCQEMAKKLDVQKLQGIAKKERGIEKTYCRYCKSTYLKHNYDRHCATTSHLKNVERSKNLSQIISDKRANLID